MKSIAIFVVILALTSVANSQQAQTATIERAPLAPPVRPQAVHLTRRTNIVYRRSSESPYQITYHRIKNPFRTVETTPLQSTGTTQVDVTPAHNFSSELHSEDTKIGWRIHYKRICRVYRRFKYLRICRRLNGKRTCRIVKHTRKLVRGRKTVCHRIIMNRTAIPLPEDENFENVLVPHNHISVGIVTRKRGLLTSTFRKICRTRKIRIVRRRRQRRVIRRTLFRKRRYATLKATPSKKEVSSRKVYRPFSYNSYDSTKTKPTKKFRRYVIPTRRCYYVLISRTYSRRFKGSRRVSKKTKKIARRRKRSINDWFRRRRKENGKTIKKQTKVEKKEAIPKKRRMVAREVRKMVNGKWVSSTEMVEEEVKTQTTTITKDGKPITTNVHTTVRPVV